MISMLTKYWFQKKNHMVQLSQLNISIDVMMMMLLDTMYEASSNDWIC